MKFDSSKIFILILFSVVFLTALNLSGDDQTAIQIYDQGCSLHESGNYTEAETLFNQVVEDYPESEAARQSLLRLAYFANRNLNNLEGSFSVKYDSLNISPFFMPGTHEPQGNLMEETFEDPSVSSDFSLRNASLSFETDENAPSDDNKILIAGNEKAGWSCVAIGNPEWRNYKVEAVLYLNYTGTGNARWHGVGGRIGAMSDEYREGYFFVFDGCDGELRMERYQIAWPPRKTLQTTMSDIKSPGWHKMSMVFSGPVITCLIDDNKVMEVKDETFKAGKAGLIQMSAIEQTLDQKISAFEEVINRYPGTDAALEADFRKGMLLQSARGIKRWEALTHLDNLSSRMSADHPLFPKTMVQVVGLRLEKAMDGLGTYDEAISSAQTVLDSPSADNEDKAKALQMKMEGHLFKQEYETAETLAHRILQNYPGERPQCLGAQYALMLIAYKEGDYEAAKNAGEELVTLYVPEDNYPLRDHQADALLYMARISEKQNNMINAQHYLDRLLSEHQNTPQFTKGIQLKKLWRLP